MRKRSGGGGSRGLEDTPFDPKLHTDSFLTSYLNSFNFVELNLGTGTVAVRLGVSSVVRIQYGSGSAARYH